jgi:hypothetical protein
MTGLVGEVGGVAGLVRFGEVGRYGVRKKWSGAYYNNIYIICVTHFLFSPDACPKSPPIIAA